MRRLAASRWIRRSQAPPATSFAGSSTWPRRPAVIELVAVVEVRRRRRPRRLAGVGSRTRRTRARRALRTPVHPARPAHPSAGPPGAAPAAPPPRRGRRPATLAGRCPPPDCSPRHDPVAGRASVAAGASSSAARAGVRRVRSPPGRYCTTPSSARTRRSLKSSRLDSDSTASAGSAPRCPCAWSRAPGCAAPRSRARSIRRASGRTRSSRRASRFSRSTLNCACVCRIWLQRVRVEEQLQDRHAAACACKRSGAAMRREQRLVVEGVRRLDLAAARR